jgi:hypothetical protein
VRALGRSKGIIFSTGVGLIIITSIFGCTKVQPFVTPVETNMISKATSTFTVTAINLPIQVQSTEITPIVKFLPTVTPSFNLICPDNKDVPTEELLSIIEPLGTFDTSMGDWYRIISYDEILLLLNTFGTAPVINYINAHGEEHMYGGRAQLIDLTADGSPELIVIMGILNIFTCVNGQYHLLQNSISNDAGYFR